MFKRNLKVYTLCLILLVVMVACNKGPVKTDNDVLLPETFVSIYMIMDYSNQFSDVVGKITSDLLQREIINIDDKDKIGDLWKEHKKYSNLLQQELDIWYQDIKYTDGRIDKRKIFNIVERLIVETNAIYSILNDYIGEENSMIMASINNRMINIYAKIGDNKNELK